MRIVPVLFLRDMYRYLGVHRSQTPPKTSHYSPMLHNALLAVATGFSDDPQIRNFKARNLFADEAKRLMESEVQKPNVSVVHALSMLGSFHSSSGEQGLGYVYFGIGSRVSQACKSSKYMHSVYLIYNPYCSGLECRLLRLGQVRSHYHT